MSTLNNGKLFASARCRGQSERQTVCPAACHVAGQSERGLTARRRMIIGDVDVD